MRIPRSPGTACRPRSPGVPSNRWPRVRSGHAVGELAEPVSLYLKELAEAATRSGLQVVLNLNIKTPRYIGRGNRALVRCPTRGAGSAAKLLSSCGRAVLFHYLRHFRPIIQRSALPTSTECEFVRPTARPVHLAPGRPPDADHPNPWSKPYSPRGVDGERSRPGPF